jgi:putative ABC transport system permease protein
MKALDRKLLRDLWGIKGQALAICLVMACGVAVFVMSLSTAASLQITQSTYYDHYRFAHVFASLKRSPNHVRGQIEQIPGIAQVQTRVVQSVTLDVAGMSEPAVGRIISIPDRKTPGLNDLYLREGRYIEPGRQSEVMVSEAFAHKQELRPGDSIRAIINGRKKDLKIVGIVLSPEYVYAIRPGELLPDDKRFGVFWMSYTEVAAAFDMEGAFNDVSLTLMPGASTDEVMRQLDNVLEQYGGLGSYDREQQTSNKFVSNEMKQMANMAYITPSIFLAVAAFLLNVVLSRLISTQREQIAALKAFGYSRLEVGWHYMKLTLVLVIIGVALGVAVGAWLGRSITVMYTEFFHFPVFNYYLDLSVVAQAVLVSGIASLLGTLAAVWKAIRLPPAEAMRPEPPADYRPTVVERMGLQRLFSQPARMILRHLERQPIKTAMSVLGIALAISVMVLGNFMEDTVNYIIDFQFFTTQRHDVSIAFVEPVSPRAVHEISNLPGVRTIETFRSVPIRLRHGHQERKLGIMGLPTNRTLFRLMDENEQEIHLPPEGLVLSAKLAEILNVQIGDTVRVEVLEGNRPVRDVIVSGLIYDFSDLSVYMDLDALHRLLREGDSISGAFLSVDSQKMDKLYTTLKNTPRVATVNIKTAAYQSFQETLAENILIMKTFNVIFASIIAFGVVYNSARISLSERSRELATLRVIGFTRGEISVILLGEMAVITLLAMPLGLLLGYAFSAYVVTAMATEVQRFPLVISSTTYAFAIVVVLVASLFSGLVVRRRLDHLDLVAVLKSRE